MLRESQRNSLSDALGSPGHKYSLAREQLA